MHEEFYQVLNPAELLVEVAVVLVKGGKSTAVLEILKSDGKQYILPLWPDTVCYV